jgi:hypothetical protein
MSRVLERKVQEWLEKNYESLTELIGNRECILENEADEESIPYYSLDYMVNKKIIKSANYVFNNLYLLDLLVADENISLQKGEQLYPDLLLFNPETSTFIIVEIKRSGQAEREAVTELLAYEHELQNLFPFMSKLEVCFVLISADFKPLLEHSVYSLALWQNRKVLPLKISGLESENSSEWALEVHIPDSWSLLSQGHFLPSQMSTVNLVLYDKDAYNSDVKIKDKEENIEILQRGLELIVKDGEKSNSNGFVLLSRLTDSELANCIITIGVINPFSFLEVLEYESKIKDFFADQYGVGAIDTKCPTDLTQNAKKYLKIFYDPSYETFVTWDVCKRELQNISLPILIDFFGEVDNVVNEFVLNKKVRQYYYPELNHNQLDWKAPVVGLNLLDNLLGDNIFYDGKFGFISLYEVGKLIGTLLQYLSIFKHNKNFHENEWFIGKYTWVELEFIKSYREVAQRSMSTNSVKEPFVPYRQGEFKQPDQNMQNINEIIAWFIKSFIDAVPNQNAFFLGLRVQNYFYDRKQLIAPENVLEIEQDIIDETMQMLNKNFEENELVKAYYKDELMNFRNRIELDDTYDYTAIDKAVLIDVFESFTLPLFSKIVMDVFHTLTSTNMANVDFRFLKKTYAKEYAKDTRCVMVLQQNGNLGLVVAPDEMPIFWKVDPEKEVLFWNDVSGGMHVLQKLTWNELKTLKL